MQSSSLLIRKHVMPRKGASARRVVFMCLCPSFQPFSPKEGVGCHITSSAISKRALLLLSQRDLYIVVSFSSFLIFLVIYKVENRHIMLGQLASTEPTRVCCLPFLH